jgi:hypothetical protein
VKQILILNAGDEATFRLSTAKEEAAHNQAKKAVVVEVHRADGRTEVHAWRQTRVRARLPWETR